MKIIVNKPSVKFFVGDVQRALKFVPDESIQCVVTSPPYWGLRDYRIKGQIGHEATPELYTQALVDAFIHIHRVLKKNGTVWLNLGDCYAAARSGTLMPAETIAGGISGLGGTTKRRGRLKTGKQAHRDARRIGLKHKDLVGIPWRVAFALQAAGWYLRSDIIWSKPNPNPESVKDRPTRSHEYIFLLTKSPKYYYDADAIREPLSAYYTKALDKTGGVKPARPKTDNFSKEKRFVEGTKAASTSKSRLGFINPKGKNKRSVWKITCRGYKGAHFAVFPEKLVEPCILAGSRKGDTVLDPFMGSGTAGVVARRLGRNFIGCDLNPDYVELAIERMNL